MALWYWGHRFVPVDRCLELYFSGCEFRCKDCHNQSLWDQDAGRPVHPYHILRDSLVYLPIVKRVDILGGEPTLQDKHDMRVLCHMLKNAGFPNIVYFTGHYYEEGTWKEKENWEPAWDYCDYLKYGPYIEGQEPYTEPLLGLKLAGKNQKMVKLH